MKNMSKKIVLGLFALCALFVVLLAGCDNPPSSDEQTSSVEEQANQQGNQAVPYPSPINWTEKKDLALIYQLRDNPTYVTYSYIKNMDGTYTFVGKTFDYPIPYATQFTNPNKWNTDNGDEYGHQVAQAEPNGLFPPSSAAGTWIMEENPYTGKIVVGYSEPDILDQPYPLPDSEVTNARYQNDVIAGNLIGKKPGTE